MIQVSDWTDATTWDDFVRQASDSTIMHLYGWRAVMEQAYGHKTFFLAAVDDGRIVGVLPLTLIHSLLLGRYLVSMPFMDYGGVCALGDACVEEILVKAAQGIADAHNAPLVLRSLRQATLDLPCSTEKVGMFLQLGVSEDALWKRLPPERRNRIRKGQKNGLTAEACGPEGLADFYLVFAANMRDLGSPVHSVGFFVETLRQLPEYCRILLVRYEGHVIGAGLMLLYNGMISLPWVSSLRLFFDKCPNQVLYWEVMRFGIKHGYQIFDFGRSSRNSGTFEAKRQWGAEPVQLYWYYHPKTAEPPGEDVKRLSWGVNLWQRLPLSLANTIGPWLRRGIPN